MKIEKMKWIMLILRWIVAVIFIYAGLIKIMNPLAFAEQIDNYRLLPYILVTILAATLPWLELFCGFLLIFGKWLQGTSFVLMILNLIFIIAIISALIQGLDISCGCFSTGDEGTRIGVKKLIEDLLLFIVIAVIYLHAMAIKIEK